MDLFDDIEKTAVMIRNSIRDIPDRHKENEETLKKLRVEELDILHLMELNNLNASKGWKAYKELQSVLQKRRKIKEENEILEPLAETVKKFKGQLSELDKVIGQIRKIDATQKNRIYTCRIRADLQKEFEVVSNGN